MVNWNKGYRNIKNAVCIIPYLPVFLVILDTIIITQHVPNLIGEVTALRWDVWINWIQQFQIKYDFVESATETVENST